MSADREEMAAKARAKHAQKHTGKRQRSVGVVQQMKDVAGKAADAVKGAAKKGKDAVAPPKAT